MLTSERLILRRPLAEDKAPFGRMNSDAKVMQFFPSVQSRAESDATFDAIDGIWDESGFCFGSATLHDGTYIGMIGLSKPGFEAKFQPCVEIGWRLLPEYWGKGLASEGARAWMDYGFGELGLDEIVSFTTVANHRSMKVMQKIGMSRDPDGDFDHPSLPDGHKIRPHVLYRIEKDGVS